MKDLCIIQPLNEDLLLKIGSALGKYKVNIEGLCLVSDQGKSIVHFVAEDEENTLKALEEASIPVSTISEVYVFDKIKEKITGKPGSFGQICRKLRENYILIKFAYPAENNRFILGIENIDKVKMILG